MKKSVSINKKDKNKLNGDLFLPNIFSKSKSSKSISITSPTHLSKTNTHILQGSEALLSSTSQSLLNYGKFQFFSPSKNNSLHNMINFNEDFIKKIGSNIALTNVWHNLETSNQKNEALSKSTRHKYSKTSHIMMNEQLNFLKEAYKPRSNIGKAKLEEVFNKKHVKANSSRENSKIKKKTFHIETKNSNYVGHDPIDNEQINKNNIDNEEFFVNNENEEVIEIEPIDIREEYQSKYDEVIENNQEQYNHNKEKEVLFEPNQKESEENDEKIIQKTENADKFNENHIENIETSKNEVRKLENLQKNEKEQLNAEILNKMKVNSLEEMQDIIKQKKNALNIQRNESEHVHKINDPIDQQKIVIPMKNEENIDKKLENQGFIAENDKSNKIFSFKTNEINNDIKNNNQISIHECNNQKIEEYKTAQFGIKIIKDSNVQFSDVFINSKESFKTNEIPCISSNGLNTVVFINSKESLKTEENPTISRHDDNNFLKTQTNLENIEENENFTNADTTQRGLNVPKSLTVPSMKKLSESSKIDKITENFISLKSFNKKDNKDIKRPSQVLQKYHIEVSPDMTTIPSNKSLNLETPTKYLAMKEHQHPGETPVSKQNLPDIPSRISLIKRISLAPDTIPSIMINNEMILLKNDNNSNPSIDSCMLMGENDRPKPEIEQMKISSTTPKSLQNILIEDINQHLNKHRNISNTNEIIKKNEKNGKTQDFKQITKTTTIKKTKFNKKKTISLNTSIQKSVSDHSNKNPAPEKSNKNLINENDDSLCQSKSNFSALLFPSELSLNFQTKNPIYKMNLNFLDKQKPLLLTKHSSNNNKTEGQKLNQKKMKLTFFAFIEKVKRFFEKHHQIEMPYQNRTSLEKKFTLIPKISNLKEVLNLPHYSPKHNTYTPRQSNNETLISPKKSVNLNTIKKDEIARLSHKYAETSSLSPEWKQDNLGKTGLVPNKGAKIFSSSSRNLVNSRLSHSQTPKQETNKEVMEGGFSDIKLENYDNDEENINFEENVKKIDAKMKEHDEILSNNYIYYNQKNIKTIINEEFFIYLENMISSNYFFYSSAHSSEQFFNESKENFKNFRETSQKRKRSSSSHERHSPLFKYFPKIKEIITFEDMIYCLKEEEEFGTFQEYLNHSDFKNLKMVIDEELDESLLDDHFSPLFDKIPSNFDVKEKKKNSLCVYDHSKKFKSKFLSASSPSNTNDGECLFFHDEDEYLSDNNDIINKKIKDKTYLEYFMDINVKVSYFLVYLNENVIGLITKLDRELENNVFLKQNNQIEPNSIIKLEEETNKIYKKEKMLHELGQTYLKNNKSNFLTFCEENRNLLFGFFEDYYYENIEATEYYEGDKKKKINLICQGLPLGSIGKQTSVRSLTSNNDDEIPVSFNSDGMKGAFLASRKRLIIKNNNVVTSENLNDQSNTNKSKNDNALMLLDLNSDNEIKENSMAKTTNKTKDESGTNTNSTQTQQAFNENKIIKDDLFFNKNSEQSFKIMQSRRKTNSEFKNLNFKGNSPIEKKNLFPQKSFNKKLENKHLFKDLSIKKILPQIPENELRLPYQKSFKIKKNEDLNDNRQPKIFIEIPKSAKISEKDGNSASLIKAKSDVNRVNNDSYMLVDISQNNDPIHISNKQSLIEKNSVTMTKNSMIFHNHLIHFNKKKNMNILEQFFFAIKDEKMNELEELFFIYPNVFIDGRDDENNTMLINAARVGNLGMINLILSKGPNMNLRNNEGNTALHYSLAYAYDDITNKLLRSGAQENIKNNEGKKPWDMLGNF